jgi:hypothetical protein
MLESLQNTSTKALAIVICSGTLIMDDLWRQFLMGSASPFILPMELTTSMTLPYLFGPQSWP